MTDLLTATAAGAQIDAASALLTAADAINPAALPPGLPVYMGYGNGRWPDYQAIVQAHPGATVLDLSVFLANLGDGGDFEPGDMTPAQAPTYVKWRLAAGVWRPIVYSSISEMPQVIAELRAAGLNQAQHFRVLTAHYGRGRHICAPGACPEATANGVTADGTQWENTPGYDLSLLHAGFLGPVVAPRPTIPAGPTVPPVVGMALTVDGGGYWIVQQDGTVHSFGNASKQYPTGVAGPLAGICGSEGDGFWLFTAAGKVYTAPGAAGFGDVSGQHLAAPVVAMSGVVGGGGYYLAGADGGVFNEGAAVFEGSLAGTPLTKPICAIRATPSVAAPFGPKGLGYWLAGADGGVFNEGDAPFYGSAGGVKLAAPVVGMAARPQGNGYWLTAADGGVFTFGQAGFFGSTGGLKLAAPVVGIEATPTGLGYYLVAADGGIFTFGDAIFHGSAA